TYRTLAWLDTSKLAQEPKIVLEEQADIVDAVTQHRDALDAHAEGKSRPALGVIPHVEQHLRVYRAGAQDFQPALVAAHPAAGAVAHDALNVHFRAGFGEGKIARAETHRALAQKLTRQDRQRAFQVGERHVFVDVQAFDLVEHRRVRGVRIVQAVHLAQRDDAHRRLLREHGADL